MDGHAGRRYAGVRWFVALVLVLLAISPTAGGLFVTAAEELSPAPTAPPDQPPPSEARVKPPPVAFFLFMVGSLHELNQSMPEALAAYRLALDYDPDSPTLITSVASVMARNGDVQGAISL